MEKICHCITYSKLNGGDIVRPEHLISLDDGFHLTYTYPDMIGILAKDLPPGITAWKKEGMFMGREIE